MDRVGHLVPAGYMSSKESDIELLKDIINELMSDHRVTNLLNMGAMRKINRFPININENFTDQFKTDKEIRKAFSGLLNTVYKDHALFEKMMRILRGNHNLMLNKGRDTIYDFSSPPIIGDNYWRIDYMGEHLTSDVKRMSTEFCDIQDIKGIINAVMKYPFIRNYINRGAMLNINKPLN